MVAHISVVQESALHDRTVAKVNIEVLEGVHIGMLGNVRTQSLSTFHYELEIFIYFKRNMDVFFMAEKSGLSTILRNYMDSFELVSGNLIPKDRAGEHLDRNMMDLQLIYRVKFDSSLSYDSRSNIIEELLMQELNTRA